jgi:hypothetical protein
MVLEEGSVAMQLIANVLKKEAGCFWFHHIFSMTYEGLTHEEACAMQLPQHVPVNPRDTRIAELERKIFQLESPHCQRLRLASCCTGIIIIAWLVCYVSYRIFPDVAYHILSWAIIHILWIILNTTCDAD